jgi:hypothetical protein
MMPFLFYWTGWQAKMTTCDMPLNKPLRELTPKPPPKLV